MSIEPHIDRAADHRDSLYVQEECYRYYVEVRRDHCTFMQQLDLTLQAPYCESCAWWGGPPDITSDSWQSDLTWVVGGSVFGRTLAALKDPDFAFFCKACGKALRPWYRDDVWVNTYHLEEHYSIPFIPGRRNPPRWLRERIVRLYDDRCFGCGRSDVDLHIDHIQPRAHGGEASFRNLQPLCEPCGQRKGNTIPEEVSIMDPQYFGPYPPDDYPHLFW